MLRSITDTQYFFRFQTFQHWHEAHQYRCNFILRLIDDIDVCLGNFLSQKLFIQYVANFCRSQVPTRQQLQLGD